MGTVLAVDGFTGLFSGDRLVSLAVNQSALNALVENKHLIQADGGLVILAAKAAYDKARMQRYSTLGNFGPQLNLSVQKIWLKVDNTFKTGTVVRDSQNVRFDVTDGKETIAVASRNT